MAEAEKPVRASADYHVSVEDVRQLMGASTPHFALQLRNRIAKLIGPLPESDPARVLGVQEIARLERLGFTGENRGEYGQDGEVTLRSNNADAPTRQIPGEPGPLQRIPPVR